MIALKIHSTTIDGTIQEAHTMVEREDISSTKLVFEHDWTQLLYCYNVYCIKIEITFKNKK